MSDESKKPRTAEAETAVVMAGCTDSLIESTGTAADNGSSQPDTAAVEEENHMSVDVIVEDTCLPSENIVVPASSTQSTARSSDNDVIDVDAIDAEAGSVEAQKDKCVDYGNPLELGLNEYYLKPASADRPAENVIDVDDEVSEAGNVSSATSQTTGAMNEVAVEQVDEKLGASEMCAVGTDGEKIGSELNVNVPQECTVTATAVITADAVTSTAAITADAVTSTAVTATAASTADAATAASIADAVTSTAASTADTEGQSKESVVRSRRSSADGNTTSPVDGSEDVIKFAEDRSNDDVSCADVLNTETERAGATERGDVEALDAAGEMITEVIDGVVARQECSTDTVTVSGDVEALDAAHEMITEVIDGVVARQECSTDTVTVSADAGSDVESRPAAAERDTEVVVMPQTVPSEDVSTADETEQTAGKTVDAELGSRDEKMRDSAEGSDTAELLSEAKTSAEKIEHSEHATDDKAVTDTAQPMHMTDKPVSDSEPIKQSLESMDMVVADSENVTESAEVMNSAAVNVETTEQDRENVEDIVSEVVLSEVQQTAQSDEQHTEMMETVDVPSTDGTTDMVPLVAGGTTDIRAEGTTDMVSLVTDGTAVETVRPIAETVADEGKDVTDMTVNDEASTAKAVAEDGDTQGKDVIDNREIIQQATEMAEAKEVTDVSVVGDAAVTENVDENMSCVNEMKDVTDTEDRSEQLQSDVNKAPAGENIVTESDRMMDTDVAGKDCGSPVTAVSEMTQSMSASDNQQVTDVIDKLETDGELMEVTDSTVTTADNERTTDGDCEMGTTETADKMSAAGEIVCEVSAECRDGKTTQEAEMKTSSESLMASDEAAAQ